MVEYKYKYIYKITCTKGKFKDHFYFGKHSTNNLNDGYKGSGKKLCDYYRKHPDDYVKDIIAFYNSEEELNQAEYDTIHPWLNNPMCLNLMEGGNGGAPSKETAKKISSTLKGRPTNAERWLTGKPRPEETRKKISETMKGRPANNKGKKMSPETVKKATETRIARHAKWVTNGMYNYLASELEIQKYLDNGFHFGRTNNNKKISIIMNDESRL